VQVWAKHCPGPVKSVIPVEALEFKVIDAGVINMFVDV
jgi:hypothetical protein